MRYWPKVKLASEGSVGPFTCEFEIKPILAMEGGTGPRQNLRPVPRHPGEMNAHLAGVDAGAGAFVMGGVVGMAGELLGD